MICQNCGSQIDLNAKFCPKCGNATAMSDSNNVGKITVIREKKVLGFAIPFEAYVDNTFLGKLPNDSTVSCSVPFGIHEVKIVSTGKDLIEKIEISASQTTCEIHIVPKMGLVAAVPHIKEIKYN